MPPRISHGAITAPRAIYQPAWRHTSCSCLAARSKPVVLNRQASQQTRSIKKAPKVPRPQSSDDFSLEHVTLATFSKAQALYKSDGHLSRSTTAEYFACAQAFAAAVKNGSNPGVTYLLDRPEFDAAVMYETACILVVLPRVSKLFGISMLASASGLGFVPATLDGTYLLLTEKLFGKLSSMSKLEGDFRRLLALGKDPNVITLEGARLTNENRMTQSEAAFRRALKLGGERFAYKWVAQRGLGFVLHTRDPQSREALRLFEEVYTTHPVQVAPWLIEMYGSTNPERTRELFFMMALNKEPSAYDKLVDYELGMAWEAPNGSQKREHELWAAEFQRLRTLGGRSKIA